jgi:hypothetical protein
MKNSFDIAVNKIDDDNLEVGHWIFSLVDEQEQADDFGMNLVEYFEHNAKIFTLAAQWLAENLPPEDSING